MAGRSKILYTIGYGAQKVEDFLDHLRQHEIEVVVDVRRFPTSKREEFKKENIRRILKREGIGYRHIAGLGGYRGGYRRYARTPEFRRALSELVKIATGSTTAIMCLEENPRWCHRKYIAYAMMRLGFRIRHIMRDGSTRSSLPPKGR